MSAADTFRDLKIEAADAFHLAAIYWSDGAFASAAAKFDQAADLLRRAQAVRNAKFGIEDPAAAPVTRIPAELSTQLAEFFDRTMGKMNVGASALDAQAIANWNACGLGVEKHCRHEKEVAGA